MDLEEKIQQRETAHFMGLRTVATILTDLAKENKLFFPGAPMREWDRLKKISCSFRGIGVAKEYTQSLGMSFGTLDMVYDGVKDVLIDEAKKMHLEYNKPSTYRYFELQHESLAEKNAASNNKYNRLKRRGRVLVGAAAVGSITHRLITKGPKGVVPLVLANVATIIGNELALQKLKPNTSDIPSPEDQFAKYFSQQFLKKADILTRTYARALGEYNVTQKH